MKDHDNAAAQRMANESAFPEHIAVLNPRWVVGMDGRRQLAGTSQRGSRSHLAMRNGEISSGSLLFAASILTDNMKCLAWALKILAEESLGQCREEENFRLFTDLSASVIDGYMDDFSEFIALADFVNSKAGAAP